MSKNMSKLIDHTEGKLAETIAYARKIGDSSLINAIQWKRKRWGQEHHEVHLYSDFAYMSLYFELKDTSSDRIVLNGGIIYSGPRDDGKPEEYNFSVSLNPRSGWSTHT